MIKYNLKNKKILTPLQALINKNRKRTLRKIKSMAEIKFEMRHIEPYERLRKKSGLPHGKFGRIPLINNKGE